MGDDFFCESGARTHSVGSTTFYSDDPLWDGENCGEHVESLEGPCCTGPPWFHKDLLSVVSDDIELRLCSNQPNSDEEVTFQYVEIYVQ